MAIKALGATLKKGSTSVGPITSVSVEINEDEQIDVTTLGNTSGYRDYLAGMHAADTITWDAEYDKTAAVAFLADVRDSSSDTYTFTTNEETTDSTYSGNARAKKLTISIDGYEGSVKMSGELEVTGAWTFTAGS